MTYKLKEEMKEELFFSASEKIYFSSFVMFSHAVIYAQD